MARISAFKDFKYLITGISLGVLTAIISLLIWNFDMFNTVDAKIMESFFILRGPIEKPSPEIIIISIGDKDIETFGKWQWPRTYHAAILEVLQEYDVKAVGYDVLFLDNYKEDPEGDIYFAKTVEEMNNVVIPITIDASGVKRFPYNELKQAVPNNIGFVNLSSSYGKLINSVDIIKDDAILFSLKVLMNYLGADNSSLSIYDNKGHINISNTNSIDIPLNKENQAVLNYAGPSNVWQWYSLSSIINSYRQIQLGREPDIDLNVFRGKIALIGVTWVGSGDIWKQPFGLSYGVELHANFINSVLQNNVIKNIAPVVNKTFLVFIVIMLSSALMFLRPRFSLALSIVLSTALLSTSYYLFAHKFIWLNVMRHIVAVFFSSILAYFIKYISEERQRHFIRETFGRYVSENVAKEVLESPGGLALGGKKEKVTIIMTDLRGFTSLSERTAPETVMSILNNYFGFMTDIIIKYEGTIDEFIGDAILVIFGAPLYIEDHAARAVACAIEMQNAMKSVNQWNRDRGFPDIQMGIGINTGSVIVGNIGSTKRTKFCAVGKHVNLTARVESFTVGGQILISENVMEEILPIVKTNSQFEVKAKGIDRPISIYSVIAIEGKYNIHLEQDKEEPLIDIKEKGMKCVFVILEGKHISDASFSAHIAKLSTKEMVIELSENTPDLDMLTNLHFSIVNSSNDTAARDIYGKVVEALDGSSRKVRITSAPQEAAQALKQIIGV
ncbi:adenylate/guanylate cyclase with Chase sensor [Candidatus Magnetoovum chiemensis]|nr:adenylate/guanylate cyclase with Chase sensor [Candidatus Magnetoovum chiemensis]